MPPFVRRDEPLISSRSPAVPTQLKPNIENSKHRYSFGSPTLDKLVWSDLFRQQQCGLITFAETQSTDYSSSVLKCFASVEIGENRSSSATSPSLVVVGDNTWLRQLPSAVKSQNASTASTADPANGPGSANTVSKELRIAWRYQQTQPQQATRSAGETKIDFKKPLSPAASDRGDYIFIRLQPLPALIGMLENVIKQQSPSAIVIPSFLHPAMYSPSFYRPDVIVPFLFELKRIAKDHGVLVVMSMSEGPLSQSNLLLDQIKALSDAFFELEAFEDDRYQGFFNVYKVPGLSDHGHYEKICQNKAFRVTRTGFEVDDWSIPAGLGPQDKAEKNKPALPTVAVAGETELF